ncbi:unnamed protein product [Leptidea sinapis]|uniref:Uncharacterized protein n=1 Tax=Leptidea sinapis TaxID=189913 RepID=A0A5E4Q7S3_9NEOP|nr:unnamed protein product [Leptidea sinapis]
MFDKTLILLTLLALQAQCLSEVRLDDLNVHYIQHPLIGTSFGIAKSRLQDSLVSCHIIFPNGILYEVFPNANHPNLDLTMGRVQPLISFESCSFVIRNVDSSYSGTYELLSTVREASNNNLVLTRRRFLLTVVESDFS